jgi:hypothetical protein
MNHDSDDLEFSDGEEHGKTSSQIPPMGGIFSILEREKTQQQDVRHRTLLDFLNPDIKKVEYLSMVLTRWLQMGKDCASHDLFCVSEKCTRHTETVSWCSFHSFLEAMEMQVAEEPADLQAILREWQEKPLMELVEDPRYIGFCAGYNGYLIKKAALKEKLSRAPVLRS